MKLRFRCFLVFKILLKHVTLLFLHTQRRGLMSVNRVFLLGNLGKDPELRHTPSGAAVCTFSIATSERFKTSQGKQQERTEWHNIVVSSGLAEICGRYLHKGKQVYIEGKIQTRSYDYDGNKRYLTEIVANEMQMLGQSGDRHNEPTPPPKGTEKPRDTIEDPMPF